MNDDNRDIDRLLQANVEGQLARVDWERLNEDVLKRLATAGLRHRPRTKYLRPLAIAAGLIVTAGVLVAIVLRLREPAPPASGAPGRATVSLLESAAGAGTATVVLGGTQVARCEVTLIDSSGPPTEEPASSRWCLVVQGETSPVESRRRPGKYRMPILINPILL